MKLEQFVLVFALVILAIAAVPAPAPPAGAPAFLPNDPKRPVASIAADLGITAAQFVACFDGVTPAPRGSAPTPDEVHANKQHLLACLQAAKSTITNDQLDAVMDKYRPST